MGFQNKRPEAGLDWAAIKTAHEAQLTPLAKARSDAMAKAARQGATPAELRSAADRAEAEFKLALAEAEAQDLEPAS